MYYDKLVPLSIVPLSQRGKEISCLFCQLGVDICSLIEENWLKGVTSAKILERVKRKFPNHYILVRCPKRRDIEYHMGHSKYTLSVRREAKKRRRALDKERKTIEEINEEVMGNIAKAIGLVSDIDEKELKKLSIKEKFEIFEKGARLLQGEKKLQLEIRKTAREEADWLKELSAINQKPSGVISSESGAGE